MSLINEALKRAKQAQQQKPPETPPMQFRPVEPGQQPNKSSVGIWIAVGIIALLAIGFVVRKFTRENGSNIPKEARAREIVPANPFPRETAPAVTTKAPIANASELANHGTNAPVVDEVPAKPAPKLQAVVFDPKHPSAIISGKTLFVGDKMGDLRVVKITRESATLVGGGQTNLLVLGQ
jgi:hypothetical protein